MQLAFVNGLVDSNPNPISRKDFVLKNLYSLGLCPYSFTPASPS
jgi:hypothetical protein